MTGWSAAAEERSLRSLAETLGARVIAPSYSRSGSGYYHVALRDREAGSGDGWIEVRIATHAQGPARCRPVDVEIGPHGCADKATVAEAAALIAFRLGRQEQAGDRRGG